MEESMKQQGHGRTWILTILVSILVLGGACLATGCSKNDSPGAVPAGASDPNGAGVREDVRAYIEATYPDSAKTRAALFQYAKVMEKALADASNKQLSIQHAEESNRASTCLLYIRTATDDAREVRLKLMPVVLNTDARNKAYFTYNDQLGGQVFMGIPYDQRVSACDINPSTLPN
ncbi:MAG: hypothetical protein WAZ27_01115 [Minisyncoccia bacterium]